MSLPDRILAPLVQLLVLAFVLTNLAACSVFPVYGDAARAQTRYDLTFAEPGTRLEQIVVQDLQKAFGQSANTAAVLVSVDVTNSSLRAGATGTSLDGEMTLYRQDPLGVGDPIAIYRTTRTATVSRDGASQSLANAVAGEEAAERAAAELAENLRLTLLSVLATLDQQGLLSQPYGASLTLSN